MNASPVQGMEEDEVFSILSHPLRRKILRSMYHKNSITFTEMSDWGVKTGTLYFHLRELAPLIQQNDDKKYSLTKSGKTLSQWFITDSEGKTRVNKINSFTLIAQPIYAAFEQSKLYQSILLILFLSGFILAPFSKTLLIGSLPLPALSYTYGEILLISCSFFILQYLILTSIVNLIGKRSMWILFLSLIVSNLFNIIIGIVFGLIIILPIALSISLNFISWLILAILSQSFFVILLTGSLIIGHSITPTKAILVSVGHLYMNVIVALSLNLY